MIPQHVKDNFETFLRAVRNGDICLMECFDQKEEGKAYLICAVWKENEMIDTIPFARMIDENPYERYLPPTGTKQKKGKT